MRNARAMAVLAVSMLLGIQGAARAEVPPKPDEFDCGPISLGATDSLVLLNVANVSLLTEPAAELQLQLIDGEGSTLAERRVSLTPGRSASLSLRVREPRFRDLVRGAVKVTVGTEDLRLAAVLQVFLRGLGLTNGPTVRCSGDTGAKGPA